MCEVLSASTRKLDLCGKRPIYAREGVGHLWLVDPVARTLEVFELRDREWVLILPPRITPHQVVIVPIPRGDWRTTVLPPRTGDRGAPDGCRRARRALTTGRCTSRGGSFGVGAAGRAVAAGDRSARVEQQQVLLARRDTREKLTAPMEGLEAHVAELLDAVQATLFARAVAFRDSHILRITLSDKFRRAFDGRPGLVSAPWCGSADCEAQIKADTQPAVRSAPRRPATACATAGRG